MPRSVAPSYGLRARLVAKLADPMSWPALVVGTVPKYFARRQLDARSQGRRCRNLSRPKGLRRPRNTQLCVPPTRAAMGHAVGVFGNLVGVANAHPDRNAGHADGMARKLAALDVLAARRELFVLRGRRALVSAAINYGIASADACHAIASSCSARASARNALARIAGAPLARARHHRIGRLCFFKRADQRHTQGP